MRTIKASYYRLALDLVDAYESDAVMNGLKYDRHSELMAIEMFAQNIMEAGHDFLQNPSDMPFILVGNEWFRCRIFLSKCVKLSK